MPAATFDPTDIRPQVVRIPHKTDSLMGVDSLPVSSALPVPVKASAEAPRATTQRTYPEPRKAAAKGLHAAILEHRPALAGVAQAMAQRPKTRDDKTPEHVQQEQFIQAQEQEIVDAVIGQVLKSGFRVYPDGLHCEGCQTPLNEALVAQAAASSYSRARMIAEIFAEAKDTAKLNARAVLMASEDAATAWTNKDREGWQNAMAMLCAALSPVKDN